MSNKSHNGYGAQPARDFAAMLKELKYEEMIQLFDDLAQEFANQAQDRRGDRKKQLANMIQSVAYGIESLKKRLEQMQFIGEYSGKPSVIRGYHGTTLFAAKKVVGEIDAGNPNPFQESRNDWDWLGYGVYFWLEAPYRAAERAAWWYRILRKQRPWLPNLFDLDQYPPPKGYRSHFAVIEARIRLFPETTLNLLDTSWVEKLEQFKEKFIARVEAKMEPERTLARSNYQVLSEFRSQQTSEGLLQKRVKFALENPEGEMRTRDCQLFNEFLQKFPDIQCIIAAFREGKQIIPGVNIWDKDHVQVNVLDQSSIDLGAIKIFDANEVLETTK